jgi:NADH dehydrogenase
MERAPAERRRLLTFVVAGANYAGVEVAGELREFLPDTARRYFRHILPDEISVVLVCSTDHILPELRSRMPGLVQYAERTLADDPHLKVLYGRKLAAATIDEALLSDGTRIPTRTIVSCTGMSVVPVLDSVNLQKDAHGRLVADCYGHAAGKTDIWTGGDCGAVPQPDGSPAPPLAIWAITVGKLIGKNIMRQIDGERLMPYRFSGLGDACVFGHRHAIASLKGIPLRGRLAWLIWRLFMVSYLPSPEKKLRVLGNWLTAPFFGRDLISISLFIIQQGEVDVIKDDHGVERHLATLGQGQHFGEIAVFQACPRTATVRARGHVRVLQMRREAALALSGSLAAVGASLKPLPKGSHKP